MRRTSPLLAPLSLSLFLFLPLLVLFILPHPSLRRRPLLRRPPRPLSRPAALPQPPLPRSPPRDAADWARPRALHAFAQPCDAPCVTRLVVATQGLHFPVQRMGMRVRGCLVGGEVLEVVEGFNGVFVCEFGREVRERERVSVVVEREGVAEKVFEGRLAVVGGGFVGREGDLEVEAGVEGFVVKSEIARVVREDEGDGEGEARFEVCLMTQEKNWGKDLVEWVDWHRRLGVDMVYIYDNGVWDVEMEKAFGGRDDVEVVTWPWFKSQQMAQAHFLRVGRRRCEWTVLCDVDEWAMPVSLGEGNAVAAGALREYVRRLGGQGFDQMLLREIKMGNSGHQYRPEEAVPEAYTFLAKDGGNGGLGKAVKPIVRMDAMKASTAVHYVQMRENGTYHMTAKNADGVKGAGEVKLEGGEAYFVHFQKRSWEDYVRKIKGGRNGLTVVDWDQRWNASEVHADRPRASFLQNTRSRPFTLFRDCWRETTKRVTPLPNQILTRMEDGKRCRQDVVGDIVQGLAYCER